MRIRIATWNVNSVRLRAKPLRRFVRTYSPDILCLQEIKTVDAAFPRELFQSLGFSHQAIYGQKGYHGVATLSRLPLSRVRLKKWCKRTESRHVYASILGGVEIHNVYVPAGGDVPDPSRNERFAFKLRFLREMARWFRRRRTEGGRWILVGDLNVAPLPNDVWSHERLRRVVTHTPIEVDCLGALRRSCDWTDAVRAFVPESKRLYTWWSYRAGDWRRADKGRRLDHIWITPALRSSLREATVVRSARGWKPASDHAPVLATLDMA